MGELTDTESKILKAVARAERQGGKLVNFVNKAIARLESIRLLYVNRKPGGSVARIRCTPKGLKLAKELETTDQIREQEGM